MGGSDSSSSNGLWKGAFTGAVDLGHDLETLLAQSNRFADERPGERRIGVRVTLAGHSVLSSIGATFKVTVRLMDGARRPQAAD